MIRCTEVIFENGVFRPLETLSLPEHQHFRITLEEVEPGREQAHSPKGSLLDAVRTLSFTSHTKYPSRDELHDRNR